MAGQRGFFIWLALLHLTKLKGGAEALTQKLSEKPQRGHHSALAGAPQALSLPRSSGLCACDIYFPCCTWLCGLSLGKERRFRSQHLSPSLEGTVGIREGLYRKPSIRAFYWLQVLELFPGLSGHALGSLPANLQRASYTKTRCKSF